MVDPREIKLTGTRLYKTTRLFQYRYTSFCAIFQLVAYLGLLPLRYQPQEFMDKEKEMPEFSKDLHKKIHSHKLWFDAWGVFSLVSFFATKRFFRNNVLQLWKLSDGTLQADTITLVGKLRKVIIPLDKLAVPAKPYKTKTTQPNLPLSKVVDVGGQWLVAKFESKGIFKKKTIMLDKDGLVENPIILVNVLNGLDFDFELPEKQQTDPAIVDAEPSKPETTTTDEDKDNKDDKDDKEKEQQQQKPQ